jgi:hypothetical protein
MRLPYQLFIRYLLTRKVDVNRVLKKVALPHIDTGWLEKEWARVRGTAPPTVREYLDSSAATKPAVERELFHDWAQAEGILPFWQGNAEVVADKQDPAVAAATKLFLNRLHRTVVGTMLLGGIATADTIKIVEERCGLRLDARTVQRFEELFWKVTEAREQFWLRTIHQFEVRQRILLSAALLKPLRTEDARLLLGLGAVDDTKACQSDQFQFFSVQIERTPIPTLAELDGELSSKA